MKKVLVILILASLIFLGGQCGSTGKTATTGPFAGGFGGLSIKFDTENMAPPSQFDVTESIPLNVIVKNNGEHNLEAGEAKVKIEGILPTSFGLSDQYKSTSAPIKGIDKLVTDGQEQIIELGNAQYKDKILGEQDVTFFAKLCYPYQTNAQIRVCMGQKISDITCSISGEKIAAGTVSAAPIQITSITQEPKGTNRVLFKINMENKGVGEVYASDQVCETIATSSDKNTVNVEITPADVKCTFLDQGTNIGKIKLSQGKKILICERPSLKTDSNYEELLNIKLKYKYVDKTSTKVKIVGS